MAYCYDSDLEFLGELDDDSLDVLVETTAIRQSGFLAYRIIVIVANAIAKALHGLKFATNVAITRTVGVFAGPIGWAVTGAWTAIDLAGPAYRVTIPLCLHIACLRQMHKYEQFKS